MLYLTNKALKFESLVELFNQEVLVRAEPKSPAPSLLTQFRKKLQSVYFPTHRPTEITQALIQRDRRFATYPELNKAMTFIFGSEDKEAIQAQLTTIIPTQLSTANAKAQWENLNHSLHYFEGNDLLPLFTELAQACRAMSALIEENLVDEKMPYIYAYRLMVLFATKKPTPSFDEIAQKTYTLLNQANQQQKDKPYHDVILNQIQLPPKDTIRDLEGWLTLLNKTGIAVLPYFAMAPQIETQIHKITGVFKAPKQLKEAKTMAARCYYTRASENLELAELCRAYNIPEDGSECSFNKCLDYLKSLPQWPMKDSDNLPHPVTMGIGSAEGYCWVKLPTDDIRALILGRITACCQSIGGHSGKCVKDAVTLPDNGLYVLLKRKDKAPHDSQPYIGNKINDADFEIVGQSYAWISMTGNLTLDSLECSKGRVTSSVVQALLTQFAETVLTENASIKRITLGVGGGTPQDLKYMLTKIPETMRIGFQYGDSTRQLSISKQHKITHDQFNALIKKLNIGGEFKEVLRYLSDYLSDISHFEEELTQLLNDVPQLRRQLTPKYLFRLLSLTSTPSLNDLLPIDFDRLKTLSEEEKQKELSKISIARLLWREMTPTQVLNALDYMSLTEHFDALLAHHKTILHQVTENPDLLHALLRKYPEKARLKAIQEKDSKGYGVLHYIATKPNSLKILLESLALESRILAIKEKDRDGRTALHLAANSPESLKLLLESIPEAARLELIKEKDSNGYGVLHYVATKPNSLKILLESLASESHILAIKEKDRDGKTALHLAAYSPESLKLLLESIPEAARLELIKEKDRDGKTALHLAANSPESLKLLLESIPEAARLELIKEKDKYNNTVLQTAKNNLECLKMVLDIYPKEARFEAIKEQNKIRQSLLDLTDPESLNFLLDMLSQTELLQAFQIITRNGLNIDQDIFKSNLIRLPKEAILEIVKEKNNYGETLLHVALGRPDIFTFLIDTLPESDLLEVLRIKNNHNQSILDLILEAPESLNLLLNVLPHSVLLETFKIKNKNGLTTLHCILNMIANHASSFKLLIDVLLQLNLLEVLKIKNIKGENVLHHVAANYPNAFKRILVKLPKEMLFEIITEKVDNKYSILDIVLDNSKLSSLEIILNALPPEKIMNLPKYILERPEVKKFMTQHPSDVSQSNLGLFKPNNDTPETPKEPQPR